MKHKAILTLLMLLFIVLAACNPAAEQQAEPEQVVEAGAPAGQETESEQPADVECLEPTSGLHQLKAADLGICFLYPEQYDVTQSEDGSSITLYIRSLLNTEAPLFTLQTEPANGRSLEDATAEFLAVYALPEGGPQEITIGGEPALLLDNLPGQDINRLVMTIHEDVIYKLTVFRIGADYGEVGEQAEALFTQITGSFQFIPVERGAQLVAGPECPVQVEASLLYTNEVAGYCLLLPADYEVLEISTEAGNNEMAFYIDSVQDTSHPRLWIKAIDAQGQSLEELTAAHKAEIESGFEGFDVAWSFGYMLDGVQANQFDQVPGQDLSRQLVMVHNGQAFILTFTPDDPEAGDVFAEMESLYEMVVESFSFLSK